MTSALSRTASATYFQDLVEVRLLGHLQVRRRDGSLVDPREWRTGKTADLLRLLALADGAPLALEQLVEELWPEADEAHGRASLRTAVSHLRAVLGPETVERQPAGLALHGTWTDVVVYERLGAEALRLLRAGDAVDGVRTAREAEALRLGELTAYDQGSPWVVGARRAEQARRLRLLLAAAEAALSLDWLGDAAELATAATEQEPANEAAARLVMQALGRRGDRAGELRAFERCRQVLRAELDVEPSSQTRQLHAELCSGVPGPARATAAARQESAALSALLEQVQRTGVSQTVVLEGGDASERQRFVADVCLAATTPLVVAEQAPPTTRPRGAAVLVVHAPGPPPAWCAQGLPAGVLLVRSDGGTQPEPVPRIVLQPLLREELQLLAQQVLGAQPGPGLLEELTRRSAGSHCRAFDLLRSWLLDGRARLSPRGMTLVDDAGSVERRAVRTTLARLVSRLSTLDLELLGLLAVLDRPIRSEHLVRLLGPDQLGASAVTDRALVERSVDHLTDLAVLFRAGGEVGLRSAMVADAVRAWLRPSVLRRLHRAAAECGPLSSAERIVHWCTLGEPELACAAALEAAEAAVGEGRHEDARTHLLQVCYLAGPEIDLTLDGADLVEELARVLIKLDRPADAVRVLARRDEPAGIEVHSLPAALLGDAAGVSALLAGTPDRRALASDEPTVQPAADRRGRRQAGHLPDAALPHGLRPGEPGSGAARHLVEVLLGDAAHAERGLTTLRRTACVAPGSPAEAVLELLLALVDHDLGQATTSSGPDLLLLSELAGPDWGWVPVRILTERWQLAAARTALTGAPAAPTELGRQLLLLGQAALAEAEGDRVAAVGALCALVGRSIDSGCTVLLPEAAARLARVSATDGLPRAQEHFDLFEWSLGEHEPRPRASSLRLLARAAIRRQLGDPARAAAAAAQAAQVARGSRLPALAADAQLARAQILAASGSAEAVTAMAAARAAYRALGIDPPALSSASFAWTSVATPGIGRPAAGTAVLAPA